jgi:hypothetical protein
MIGSLKRDQKFHRQTTFFEPHILLQTSNTPFYTWGNFQEENTENKKKLLTSFKFPFVQVLHSS